jgi:hypothetical protein
MATITSTFSRVTGSGGEVRLSSETWTRWRTALCLTRCDEDGFSSYSTCPCHRAAPIRPAAVTDRFGQPAVCHTAFARAEGARPPELNSVEATTGFICVAAR